MDASRDALMIKLTSQMNAVNDTVEKRNVIKLLSFNVLHYSYNQAEHNVDSVLAVGTNFHVLGWSNHALLKTKVEVTFISLNLAADDNLSSTEDNDTDNQNTCLAISTSLLVSKRKNAKAANVVCMELSFAPILQKISCWEYYYRGYQI